MKAIINLVCILGLFGNAAAFDLPAMDAAGVRSAEISTAGPAVPAPVETTEDWAALRAGFFRAAPPSDLKSLIGLYKGRLHPLYEREDYTVPFVMAIYSDPVTGAIKAAFPMYNSTEIVSLKLTPQGAEVTDAWGGRAKIVIRRDGSKLRIFTSLYSDETYGVCEEAGEMPFPGSAAKASGNLEEDMPHGAIPGDASTGRAAAVLREFSVEGLQLDVPDAEIARQENDYSGLRFEKGFREAMRSYFNDYSDIESPMCVVLDNLVDYSCENPTSAQFAQAQRQLRALMALPGTKLRILRKGDQPEWGESVKDNWMFKLNLDYTDHVYWAIVDRSGKKPAYNYGFN